MRRDIMEGSLIEGNDWVSWGLIWPLNTTDRAIPLRAYIRIRLPSYQYGEYDDWNTDATCLGWRQLGFFYGWSVHGYQLRVAYFYWKPETPDKITTALARVKNALR